MQRNASAIWTGGLKDGKGTLSAPSGAIQNTPYSFGTRFESAPGTNPEELIAAAHAGCFSMALSGALEQAGMKPRSIQTKATITLEKEAAGFTVKSSHLDVTADVENANPAEFEKAAQGAKQNCPISRLLKAEITMEARLGSVAGAR